MEISGFPLVNLLLWVKKMGCWNETCALTGLPIKENDRVVMVLFREESFTIPKKHFDEQNFEKILFCTHGVFRGTYNEYGWIKELKEDKVRFGENAWTKNIFFFEEAWDLALSHNDLFTKIDGEIVQNEIKSFLLFAKDEGYKIDMDYPWLKDLVKVFAIAHKERIDLFSGSTFSGSQGYDVQFRKKLKDKFFNQKIDEIYEFQSQNDQQMSSNEDNFFFDEDDEEEEKEGEESCV